MVTKPCPRAGQHGCLGAVTADCQAHLRRRRYCTKRCAWHGKVAAGWVSGSGLTKETRARGGCKGAKVAGERRHRAAMERAVRECATLIPDSFTGELSARSLALVKVLLGRAFERGRVLEIKRLDNQRRRKIQRERQGAA